MFSFAIDRGGTFTDVWCKIPSGKVIVRKLLSEDPENYDDAPREAIRRILSEFSGTDVPKGSPIPTEQIQWIRMGTTVATNALLERKGERFALLVTKGFRDLLYIGNQSRPDIFDLSISMPEMLYERVIEVDERVLLAQPSSCRLDPQPGPLATGVTGESVHVSQPLNMESLRTELTSLLADGIRCVAVLFLHSYLYPEHELAAGRLAEELGFSQVSLSHRVMQMVRAVPRGHTACADAYLTPCIDKYIEGFASGFAGGLKNLKVLFMQSDGGLAPVNQFNGSRAILSGPAGGVVGYALTTHRQAGGAPVIGFDMGGTSTDVSRFDGQLEHVFETTTAGVAIQAPQLDINTVAAGGGSRLFFRSGLFVVGPESAGAHPGPVCYRKGGPLTVTDANLVLGRLLPDQFPKIFGPTADQALDAEGARQAMSALTDEINAFLSAETGQAAMSVEEAALGFVRVANESMCRPIRALTQAKGHNTAKHALACFGGAGGQHACAIARSLGMTRVFVHKYSGILSAFGLALADVVHEAQEPCALEYRQDNLASIEKRFQHLEGECLAKLTQQGFDKSCVRYERYLHLRYDGTDCAVMCRGSTEPNEDYLSVFVHRYRTEFGFTLDDRRVLIDDIRVRGVASSGADAEAAADSLAGGEVAVEVQQPEPVAHSRVYFEGVGWQTVGIYRLDRLSPGQCITGPAVVLEQNSTVLVEPDWTASLTKTADLLISRKSAEAAASVNETAVAESEVKVDSIQLSIFSHRFMSIAEQMGRVLQRTSISTNIKERLDFSCALFGPDGGLVANAPHIPVHLGAMQETVRYQMANCELLPGDVILANHPRAGGSHLPDLTVITPVFLPGSGQSPIFFVANRGHHADIGGRTPGSMPPDSHSILEEGAVFRSFHLVRGGQFREAEVTKELMAPAQLPGCSGTRNLHDNLSDLRAQVAANQKGVALVTALIEEYSLGVVQAYMKFIQANAETAVRDLLRRVGASALARTGASRLSFADSLDDGSDIRLSVDIDAKAGSAVFDFAGTSLESHGNLNAPRAVTMSALIYCLRCMVPYSIPLNQGCLAPIQLRLPEGSLLSPSDIAAVVGGNVLTSQRIVDVILGAFSACAASQGCMNNVTFGDDSVGYYETVAGGSGAGPSWHGRSGVHTHMTNTRITDVEILERRYPVIVDHFSLCPGTGGQGQFNGGDGILRVLRFRKDLTLSVLTERRVHAPYGLKGGQPGSRGSNSLEVAATGRRMNLGAKTSVSVGPGDRFVLRTPGGGGFGPLASKGTSDSGAGAHQPPLVLRGTLVDYEQMQFSA
ncbi:hypothetical protein BOX15_Mlig031794g1 [Macrostomum lignano]|uniref:5-oxoprolinase n=2 Tax=Macrostomum lignano TaxID=282301 RepID=A0A267FCP8_9PLAT|nr:hypothetical protein BOX15_Mlig031794g1 [Macrostomum lignano]